MILEKSDDSTYQTAVATFIDAALVKDHAGGEEGEGVDEDGEDPDAAEQAERPQGGNYSGCAQHECHDVRHAGHADRHPCIGECLPKALLQTQFQLLLGEVLVGLDEDEHVVYTNAKHEEGKDVVELGEHEATGRADTKAEDASKDNPGKA